MTMTHDEQGQALYAAVSEAIEKTMYEGQLRGYNGQWLRQEIEHHLEHAEKHLTMLGLDNRDEDHLAHAITRLAMARFLSRRE
jgi:hypothetical protein